MLPLEIHMKLYLLRHKDKDPSISKIYTHLQVKIFTDKLKIKEYLQATYTLIFLSNISLIFRLVGKYHRQIYISYNNLEIVIYSSILPLNAHKWTILLLQIKNQDRAKLQIKIKIQDKLTDTPGINIITS